VLMQGSLRECCRALVDHKWLEEPNKKQVVWSRLCGGYLTGSNMCHNFLLPLLWSLEPILPLLVASAPLQGLALLCPLVLVGDGPSQGQVLLNLEHSVFVLLELILLLSGPLVGFWEECVSPPFSSPLMERGVAPRD
jgi:hypothetical protein